MFVGVRRKAIADSETTAVVTKAGIAIGALLAVCLFVVDGIREMVTGFVWNIRHALHSVTERIDEYVLGDST